MKRTAMSTRELERVEIFGRVASKQLRLLDAMLLLELSYRQVKRLWKRFRKDGAEALKHGNAGRSSNRAKATSFRQQVLQRVREKYWGEEEERFGPTLAAEHLGAEDGLQVDGETLRRWMLAEGLWSRQRKRQSYRRRRERKAHFGELVQMDGSFHAWFERRGPRGCLLNMVDDATGINHGRLGKEETIWAAVAVLRGWIEQYEVPLALYTDWKNLYKRRATVKEQLAGVVPETQFGRMCTRLGIQIIAARSPQAKGRVERHHGTHQDRLVKKLRRQGIQDYAAANAYLTKQYLPEHNQRFARPALQKQDYHRPAPTARELRAIFRLETPRRIGNDWVVRYRTRYLQLQPKNRVWSGGKRHATVCEYEDGSLEIYYQGERIEFVEMVEKRRRRVKRDIAMPWQQWKRRQQEAVSECVAAVAAIAPVAGELPCASL